MNVRALGLVVAVVATVSVAVTSAALAGSGTPMHPPRILDDSQVQNLTVRFAGADALPTTHTVPHWLGTALDPVNGITYGYNIVGADPDNCSGATCSVTIEVDITPLIVTVDGMTFSGMDVLAATLASPQFALNDYGSTPFATTGPVQRGPGGVLSQGDAGQPLQLQDAMMRAQFNQTGASRYHVTLHPNILPAITIDVPANQAMLLQSARGNVFAAVDYQWWAPQLQNLETKADPTHLAVYLTDDVFLYFGSAKSFSCCVFGYHGAKAAGNFLGSGHSNGNAPVQTFVFASWMSPGINARPNGGRFWHVQDMVTLSHEIAEWANDPFGNNVVEPWGLPFAPQFGCQSIFLETGDAVSAIGFAVGTNSFRQGPNPDGTQSADGYYHPQDEVFIPWFLRESPNLVSEPTQMPSPNIGRYTFLGDLNPYGFNGPSPGCI